MALESKIVDNPGVNQSNFDVRVDQSNSDFQAEDRLLAKVPPNINDVPRGYSDEPLFTVKEVASGTQLILRNGQVGAGQRTFGDDDYTYFVDYENRVTPVLLVGVDGQVLQIPAGHAVNLDALRDGDTIHLPLERENEARREYLRQIVPSGSGQTAVVPLASDLVDRLRWHQGNIPQVSQSQQDVASMSIPEKFGQAIQLSVQDNRLSDQVRKDLSELVKPENLAVMAGVLATWAGLTAVGGPVGVAANVALFGAGAVQTAQMLYDFVVTATQAETPEDLDRAAGHFAELVSAIGTDVLLGIVARPGKYADELLGLTQKFAPDIAKLTGRAKELSASLFRSAGNAFSKAGDAFARIGQGLTDIGQGIISRVGDAVDDLTDFIRGITQPMLSTAGGQLPGPGGGRSGRGPAIASSGAETVASQVARIERGMNDLGVNPSRIRPLLREASRNPKIRDVLDKILGGPGKLRNPDALQSAVERSVREGRDGVNDFRELELAASYIRRGQDVSVGGIADVVIHSNPPQAIQLKNVRADTQKSVLDHLTSAAKQLGGDGGEHIPKDASGQSLFTRVAKVIVNNPNNPFYDKSPRQIAQELNQLLKNDESLSLREYIDNVDEFRITNESGEHTLKVIRGRDGTFQFIAPGTTEPSRVSSQNETSMLAQTENSQLYTALESVNQLQQEQSDNYEQEQRWNTKNANIAEIPRDFQTTAMLAASIQEHLNQQGLFSPLGERTAVFDGDVAAIEDSTSITVQSGMKPHFELNKETGELMLASAWTPEQHQQIEDLVQSLQLEPSVPYHPNQLLLDA